MEIKQIPCNPKNYQSAKRAVSDIKYIVIHYVGAEGGSEANGNYYKNNNVGASAHLYVGHKGEPYVQSVPDNCVAWSVGTAGYYTQKHPYCRNANSISIELCCWHKNNVWTIDDETVEKALELTEFLMNKYNIPKENVLRHWQVVNKRCPEFWVDDNRWKKEFWNKIGVKDTVKKDEWILKLQKLIKAKLTGIADVETLSKTPTIKRGDSGEVVKLIQEKFVALGYADFEPNGKYGKAPYCDMYNSVIKYQKEVVKLAKPDGEFTANGASWKAILGIK